MRLSILFCTYNRPELLRAALHSVARLDHLDAVDVEVVVADNSDDGSAREIVAEAAGAAAFPLRYVVAHPANISLARNAAVAAATGDVLAFLDDDMQVESGWLTAVIAGMTEFDHDVMFGPVSPRFVAPDRAGPHAVAMFTRQLDQPAGTNLRALGPDRTRHFALATSNSIFRRRALSDPAPFDPVLGDGGGEDLDLFCRLERQGCHFAYLPDARASESVPAHRCAIDYLVDRHFVGAQVFAFCAVRNSNHPALVDLIVRIKAVVQFTAFVATAARLDPDSRRIRRASILGKLFWRRLKPLYRLESARLGFH